MNAVDFTVYQEAIIISLKGKPSVTPGLAMQYSLISSMFMIDGF
jgi:hypothetical protein